MTAEQHASASLNRNIGEAIMASILMEVLRRDKADPKPFAWTSGTVIHINADEWVDITDPAACIPPAHVAADAMKREQSND